MRRDEYGLNVWGYWTSIVVAGVALIVPSRGYASAWNPEAWHGEIISAQVFLSADEGEDEFGRRFSLDQYSKSVTQTFAKLGLTDRIALVGTFDWQDATIVGPGANLSFSEPSSIAFGLQYQISRREGHAVAISASYLEGIDLPPQLLTIENRKSAVELRGLWGESRTWRSVNLFAEAQLAGRVTLGGDYAGAFTQITVGGDPFERVKLIAKLRYTDVASGVFDGFALARQERLETEASIIYRFRKRTHLEIGFVDLIAGSNTVSESGPKVGLWTKF